MRSDPSATPRATASRIRPGAKGRHALGGLVVGLDEGPDPRRPIQADPTSCAAPRPPRPQPLVLELGGPRNANHTGGNGVSSADTRSP